MLYFSESFLEQSKNRFRRVFFINTVETERQFRTLFGCKRHHPDYALSIDFESILTDEEVGLKACSGFHESSRWSRMQS